MRKTSVLLPTELWQQILQACTSRDHIALCCVSKIFSSLAIQLIYRDVYLSNYNKIVGCCRTLVRNRQAAISVRRIEIQSEFISANDRPPFCDILAAAFQVIINVETIHMKPSGEGLMMPEDAQFPQLHSLVYGIPYTPMMSKFLQRHPNIQSLQLESGTYPPSETSKAYFPRLISFIGPGQVLATLVLGSLVEDALIGWQESVHLDGFDAALRALKPTAQSLTRLGISSLLWDPQFLHAIAALLPDIPNLRFHLEHFHVDSNNLSEDIGTELPKLQKLRRLVISNPTSPPITVATCDLDMQMVTSWSRLASSLSSCHLPSGITWIRLDGALWIPTTHNAVVSLWWTERLLSGRCDSLAEESAWLARPPPTGPSLYDKRVILIELQSQLAIASL